MGDPQFVDKLNDWHVSSTSPSRGSGDTNSFTGFYGEPIDVSHDRDGMTRTVPWSLGIYR